MNRSIGVAAALILVILILPFESSGQPLVANHLSVGQFQSVPATVIRQLRTNYRLFYGHTSHGSQVVSGMEMLADQDTLYRVNNGTGSLQFSEYGSDLGHTGDTAWAQVTRQALNQPGNNINIVVWSWCGGVSDNTVEGINMYLEKMADLEADYPAVKFIYMTGHLDGSGPDGNLYLRNNQIRTYCTTHNKILFDFADIESYDPGGVWYPDETDACNWCDTWCASHSCPSCGSCAHSHCFNCYQKGKAFWWLLARMSGWGNGPCCEGTRGNIDGQGVVDLGDLSTMIAYLSSMPGLTLSCYDEANCDGQGVIDLGDLSTLVAYLSSTPGVSFGTCP